jgi:amino acid adenylation domain-containing protein
MLFHAAAHPGVGVDIEQVSMRIDEALDTDRFVAAWQTVTDRHPLLRARFVWADVPEPLLVHSDPGEPLAVTVEDWAALTPTEHDEGVRRCLREDRLTDFDLAAGPLQRFVIARLAADRWWILWSFHHAILDGRSFPLVLREVFELYDQGLDHPLEPRPDFGRYVEAVANQDLTSARAYWTKRLEPVETATSIPLERVGPRPDGPAVEPVEIELGSQRTAALRRRAETEEVSLNTCIQAAWYLLLRHYSQQRVVTFGTTRACRHGVDGAQDMIGLLINTVPMTIAADGEETVGGLLRRLRQEQFELREHETTPLPVIMECAPPGVTELFETIVVFDDASLDARMSEAFPTTAERRRFHYDGQTNFPLTLLAYGDDSMLVRLEGAVDRYDRPTLVRLLDQLVNLLDGFVADPSRLAEDVPYLTEAETAQLVAWNDTGVDYDLDTTLHGLFEAQVARTPDAPALVRGDDALTYRQFNEAANRLAHHLRRRGVGLDTGVGIFAERSFEMMVGIYAILKAGGAYVPFDPEHPAERIRFMAEDSGVGIVLTQVHLVDALPPGDFDVIVLDGDVTSRPWEGEPATDPEPFPAPDNGARTMAYLLYTSGSTGRPKGAMIEHRAIVNRLLWMQDAYRLDDGDCVLQKTPYTFDVSVWELFWPLQVGARLVLAEPGGHRDTAYLAAAITHHQVTTLHFVPSMLQLFVEEPTIGTCASVRRVICSGEALPRSLQDRLFEVLDTELHNLYGPTEAAVDVTWWACDPDSPLATVPIGHPIANIEVHVLDPELRRVPVGVQGELHIGGVQLARGYHNRPELTAEKFIPDPYSSRPGARLYKTGDLVRHLPDGAVEFLGRIDHQVKIRGQRIELGEIEAVIADHASVREVVVVASGAAADTRLVAYVAGDLPTGSPDEVAQAETVLRDHCAVGLAAYMVPSVWVFLDTFPLNPNGKVDRKALPAPALGGPEREIVAAGSDAEAAIAEVWCTLLGHDRVGVTETFFDVGGNSLLLIRLAHLLTARFETPISVQQLLRHPTVRLQAELVTAPPSGEGGDSAAGPADQAVAAGARQAAARRGGRAARRRRVGR